MPSPTQVIDVGPADGSVELRLMIVDPDIYQPKIDQRAQSSNYVTLSYCWGTNGHAATTTGDNFEQMLQGIRLRSLSKTIQGAIHIMRRLPVYYL